LILPLGAINKGGRKPKVFIVQCNVAAARNSVSIRVATSTGEDTIESVADDLLEGQYNNPVRLIGFDATEKTSRGRFRGGGSRAAAALRRSKARTTAISAGIPLPL
jgi:hypothetical protein